MSPSRIRMQRLLRLIGVSVVALAMREAHAQCPFVSGSTGADGALSPSANVTRTLPPDGVLNFTTVNIPAGVTVKFQRNQNNTPVYILAKGDVTISGTIDVSGTDANGATPGKGGPGGFDGGAGGRTCGGAGLGPGGGAPGCCGLFQSCGGSGGVFYPVYGNAALTPLIGGSGGGGSNGVVGAQFGGGGGGGAILIASSGTLNMSGTIASYPGNLGQGSSGSYGAIRLVAQAITGTFRSASYGGANFFSDWMRVEACDPEFNALGIDGVRYTFSQSAGPVFLSGIPTLKIVSVGGVAAPASPVGSYTAPADVSLASGTTTATVQLGATNIPVGTQVNVSVVPQTGQPSSVMSTALDGTQSNSTASADVSLASGRSLITAAATVTIGGGSPLVVGSIAGEKIEKVRVAAIYGGGSSLTYITASGKEFPADSGARWQ